MNIDVLGRTIGYNLEGIYEKEILPKLSTKIAFANAQKSLRAKYPEPYYWGAFVMMN